MNNNYLLQMIVDGVKQGVWNAIVAIKDDVVYMAQKIAAEEKSKAEK